MSKKERFETLSGRMKAYEHITSKDAVCPNLPVIIRLDGRAFSKFTKGLNRPFDDRMISAMTETTKYLVNKFPSVLVGYTQSDEITLIIKNKYESPCEFSGRYQKLCSVLASECSVQFYIKCLEHNIPLEGKNNPVFDCRVFTVPSFIEASNCLLWREEDARVNSIQSLGHYYMSQAEMQNLSCSDITFRLREVYKVDWRDLPDYKQRGTYVFPNRYNGKGLQKPLKQYHLVERLERLFCM